jgi:hypothetical protein
MTGQSDVNVTLQVDSYVTLQVDSFSDYVYIGNEPEVISPAFNAF